MSRERARRFALAAVAAIIAIVAVVLHPPTEVQQIFEQQSPAKNTTNISTTKSSPAITVLNQLAVKGRAPMTGYSRDQFGGDWATKNGCDMRNIILHRDLTDTVVNDKCQVTKGVLNDPYTGKTINFTRGASTSSAIQIDHVVAIGDAWQTGAQQLTKQQRVTLYNDPLELLAVDGPANEQKEDGDAATWLPANKSFRCTYVARQIAVKKKYNLWVTSAEKQAMVSILGGCPNQTVPTS